MVPPLGSSRMRRIRAHPSALSGSSHRPSRAMSCMAARGEATFSLPRALSAGRMPARELAEAELVAVMREIHAESDATYGEPRMTEELAHRGRVVNHKRVRRLMRRHGIVGVFKPAKVRTTIPAEECPPLPDLVGRRFARRAGCRVVR